MSAMAIAVIVLLVAVVGVLTIGLLAGPRGLIAVVDVDDGHAALCQDCDWISPTYNDEQLAARAMVQHLRTHAE